MLQKNNIYLRAPEPEDVDFLYRMENDHKLWKVSNTLTPFSRFDLEQFVMLADKDIFATKQVRFIIEKEDDDGKIMMGAADLFDFEPQHRRAGIGIMVIEGERKKGIAGTALDIIIDYTFGYLGLHQLYCNIEENNEVSLKLFRNKGFRIVGTKKEWNKRPEGWTDEFLLQLLNTV